MIGSTRGAPVSADVYLRGKASLWTRAIRALAGEPTPAPATVRHSKPAPRRPVLTALPTHEGPPRAPSTAELPEPPAPVATVVRDGRAGPGHVEHAVGTSPPSEDRQAPESIARGVAVAVVDTDPLVRTVLKDHVKSLGIDAVAHDSVASLVLSPAAREPLVVVVGPSEPPPAVVEHLQEFLEARPDRGAVMLLFDMSAETVRSAFRAGVDDVVAVNADDAELVGAIGRAVSRVHTDLEEARPPAPVVAPTVATPAGRVITVFGAKGGTGKSVVAVNLGVALARQGATPVVLVDANLQFGDVALMLQLRPEHTIAEAVVAGDRLDGDLLGELLLRHKPSGLLVLAAPPDPVAGDRVGRADLGNVLDVLRQRCAYVIVDTSPRMEEATLAALQAADDILMVTNLDMTSLKDARLGMQTLDVLGIAKSRVKLVINQSSSTNALSQADAERAVHAKVHTVLPSDPSVADSANRGVPAMFSAPTSRFALTVAELARSLRARPAASTARAPAGREGASLR